MNIHQELMETMIHHSHQVNKSFVFFIVCIVLLLLTPLHAQGDAATNAESTMISIPNQYFDIKMDPAIAEIKNFNINEALDYVQKNISADFKFTQTDKIPIVIYINKLFGENAPGAPVKSDGDYDGTIRIKISSTRPNLMKFRSTLCHEYTHAVLQAITKGNLPRWFGEGLAEYEKFRHGIPLTLDYLGLAYKDNELIAWDKINAAYDDQYNFTVNVAYEEAFSFVYYLLQNYGMERINSLLRALGTGEDFDSAFKQIYNITLTDAQGAWKAQLPRFMYDYTAGKYGKP